MKKFLESKLIGWLFMLLAVCNIVMAMVHHAVWYDYIPLFFLFLFAFSLLASIYLKKMSRVASSKLLKCSYWCVAIAVATCVAQYFLR